MSEQSLTPPPKGATLDGLQWLRALAALAVTVHHALECGRAADHPLGADWLVTAGAFGVDVFFVISGFIMMRSSFPDARAPLTPGVFAWRRVTRIYPLYWLCVGVMLAVQAAGFMRSLVLGAGDIGLSLALLPSRHVILGVSWTLVYEVYFYIVFACALASGRRAVTLAVTAGTIAALLALGNVVQVDVLSAFVARPIVLEFLLGMGLAGAFDQVRRGNRPLIWGLAALAWVVMMLAPIVAPGKDTSGLPGWWRLALWGMPAVVMVAAFGLVGPARGWAGRWLVRLGDASYAQYLTHVFVMDAYSLALRHHGVARLPQAPLLVGVVLASVAVGLGVHLWVEAPIMRAIRRLKMGSVGGPALGMANPL